MKIDGKTRLCGLIGNPVEHTLSPLIHNTLASLMEDNLVYVPLLVSSGYLETAVLGANAMHVLGVNVTVPYKSEIIPFLSDIDSLAEKIGAVNTLVATDHGYKGYNTDMPGLLRGMKADGIDLVNDNIIILGAGGAARAVAFMCADAGARNINLLNRTFDKALAVAKEVNAVYGPDTIIPMLLSNYHELAGKSYLCIQATSVGLFPESDSAIIEDAKFYQMIHTGYDLIYRPGITKFMKLAKKSGAKTFNGLKMLLYHGIIAYELWNGTSISEDMAVVVYQKLKDELKSDE